MGSRVISVVGFGLDVVENLGEGDSIPEAGVKGVASTAVVSGSVWGVQQSAVLLLRVRGASSGVQWVGSLDSFASDGVEDFIDWLWPG